MSNGIDVVGFRSCAKQAELGPKRFIVTLKKLGRLAATVRGTPTPSLPPVAITPEQRRRLQVQHEARQALVQFDQGTPECKECPISDGKPYGCYVAIDFPIDAAVETTLFRYFSTQLEDDHSQGSALYRDLVSKAPKGSAWHTDRGTGGTLAELETPITKEWGLLLWKKRVDSAQLLGSVFFNQRRPGVIAALAEFWEGYVRHAREKDIDADIGSSTTFHQIEELSALYERVAQIVTTTEGVYVIYESDAPSAAPEG